MKINNIYFIYRVASEIIELNGYIFSEKLNIYIYPDNLYDFVDQNHHFFTFDFKEIEDTNMIIIPIGIFSLDMNIHISFKEIESEETSLTKKLKYLILNDYEPTIYKNKEKLIELTIKKN